MSRVEQKTKNEKPAPGQGRKKDQIRRRIWVDADLRAVHILD